MKKERMTKAEKTWFKSVNVETLNEEDTAKWVYLWIHKTF